MASSSKRLSPTSKLSHTTCSSLPILAILLLNGFRAAHSQHCDVNETFSVCRYEVLLQRQPDCSLIVTENFHFPKLQTNSPPYRAIPALTNQKVSGLRYTVSTSRHALLPTTRDNVCTEDDQVLVTMKQAKNTSSETHHILKYRLSNGVQQFSRRCNAREGFNESLNVIHWRSGAWDGNINVVNVTLRSPGATLRLSGEKDSKRDSITWQEENFGRNNEDLFIIEQGIAICQTDLGCFGDSGGGGGISIPVILTIVVGCVLAILAIIVLCIKYGSRREKMESNGNGDEKVIMAQHVGRQEPVSDQRNNEMRW